MRKVLFPALLAITLVAPFLLRAAVLGRGEDVGAGERRLVVVTPHNRDIRRAFAAAFSRWHAEHHGEAVAVDYRTPGGTVKIVELLDKTYAPYRDDDGALADPSEVPADIHVVWGGGDYEFDVNLKGRLGVLQPLELDPDLLAAAFPEPELAGIRLYDHAAGVPASDQRPAWVGVCLSSFGIVYNPPLIDKLGVEPPDRWVELAGPAFADLLALADPLQSGSASVAYMMVMQRAMADAEEAALAVLPALRRLDREVLDEVGGSRDLDETLAGLPDDLPKDALRGYRAALDAGWRDGLRTLTLIAANARYFTDSGSQPPTDVSQGEAAAGMAIDFYGRVYEELVGEDRIKFVSPEAATAITPDPVAILWGTKGEDLELATRFVEFLLTPEGQELWIKAGGTEGGPAGNALRRPPIRPDVYADMTGWTDRENPFEQAGGFNQRGAWMGEFTETRLVWAAAWMDARDALKRAHGAVMAVDDPDRRAALLAELGSLPVGRDEVIELRRQRKAAADEGEWAARTRIALAALCRAHYRDVAEGLDP